MLTPEPTPMNSPTPKSLILKAKEHNRKAREARDKAIVLVRRMKELEDELKAQDREIQENDARRNACLAQSKELKFQEVRGDRQTVFRANKSENVIEALVRNFKTMLTDEKAILERARAGTATKEDQDFAALLVFTELAGDPSAMVQDFLTSVDTKMNDEDEMRRIKIEEAARADLDTIVASPASSAHQDTPRLRPRGRPKKRQREATTDSTTSIMDTGAAELKKKRRRDSNSVTTQRKKAFTESLEDAVRNVEPCKDALKCSGCRTSTPKEPRLTACLHIYCKTCLLRWKQKKTRDGEVSKYADAICKKAECGERVGQGHLIKEELFAEWWAKFVDEISDNESDGEDMGEPEVQESELAVEGEAEGEVVGTAEGESEAEGEIGGTEEGEGEANEHVEGEDYEREDGDIDEQGEGEVEGHVAGEIEGAIDGNEEGEADGNGKGEADGEGEGEDEAEAEHEGHGEEGREQDDMDCDCDSLNRPVPLGDRAMRMDQDKPTSRRTP